MCGRYTLTDQSAAQLEAELDAAWRGAPAPASYNIAPTDYAPVLRLEEGERVLENYRWGLIPSWSRDASIGARTINARAETVASKPSFRAAFRERRCLVPASGYYEWQTTPEGKQPHFISPAQGALLTFAGLWEEWCPEPDVEPVSTFTIITTEMPEGRALRPLHHRVPVILDAEGRDLWLNSSSSPMALQERLRPPPEGALRFYPVHPRVGSPRHNDPECIEPLTATSGEG